MILAINGFQYLLLRPYLRLKNEHKLNAKYSFRGTQPIVVP